MVLFTNAPAWMQGIAQSVNGFFEPGIASVDNFHNAALAAFEQLTNMLP